MYLLFVQQYKLQYVKFLVVANSSSFSLNKSIIATVVVHTLNREIRSCVKWLLMYKRFKRMENYLNCRPKNGATVTRGLREPQRFQLGFDLEIPGVLLIGDCIL